MKGTTLSERRRGVKGKTAKKGVTTGTGGTFGEVSV